MNHFRLQRHAALALEFDGELLGEADSDDGTRDRWQRMRIYATDHGTYILERLGESRLEGDVTMRHVDELPNAHQVRRRLERRRDDGSKYLTIVALEVLDQAALKDEAFKEATAERI